VDRLEGQEYGPDPIEELTIACAPSAQALDAARALLRRWVVEGSSPGAMTALLSDGA